MSQTEQIYHRIAYAKGIVAPSVGFLGQGAPLEVFAHGPFHLLVVGSYVESR